MLAAAFVATILTSCTNAVTGWQDTKTAVVITLPDSHTLTLTPQAANALRVQLVKAGYAPQEELVFTAGNEESPAYTVEDKGGSLLIKVEKISAEVSKRTALITFRDAQGNVILQENGRRIAPDSIQGVPTLAIEERFASPADESLYGTGQFQDGHLNIRGLSRRLTQVNTQISIPFILSSKGYGLLWHNYGLTELNPPAEFITLDTVSVEGEGGMEAVTTGAGIVMQKKDYHSFTGTLTIRKAGKYCLMLDGGQTDAYRKMFLAIDGEELYRLKDAWIPPTTSLVVDLSAGEHHVDAHLNKPTTPRLYFKPITDETVLRSPVAQSVDYTVFAGYGDEVVSAYRKLSGPTPLLPKWTFGFVQCRERYHTQQELLENAREFRKRKLPVDVFVQDWQYWGRYGWNAMKFDETLYPNPKAMVDELHKLNIRLMISVWSKSQGADSDWAKEMMAQGFNVPGTSWVDFFNPKAADFYWDTFSKGLLKPYGIDAWWQDATEPENDALAGCMVNAGSTPGEFYRNVYPLFVNQTVYNGFRRDEPGKRVMILTRSGFLGMHRYAAATWSGDVAATWDELRRQITGGLGQMASGLPWWTYDAGGFFRYGFDNQYTDPAYHEQFLRWFEAATFLPIQRVHGIASNTEFWNYGDTVLNISRKYLDLRYRLLPYVYSQAAQVAFAGGTLMRPLVFDFAKDPQALAQNYEWMFGPTLLVAPVVAPGVSSWKVYLPENEAGWVNFWTGERHDGGRQIEAPVALESIPVYARGGSILPLGPTQEYTSQKPDAPWEIRIYPGADATFTVYEDDGASYDYEQGQFSTYDLTWNEARQTLTVSARRGAYKDMTARRTLHIVKVGGDIKTVEYEGEEVSVSFL